MNPTLGSSDSVSESESVNVMSRLKSCNIDTTLFEADIQALIQKLTGITDQNQAINIILTDDFYNTAGSLVKKIDAIDDSKLICVTGDNACSGLNLNMYAQIPDAYLDATLKILDKYEPIINTLYNKSSNYSIDLAQKCGQDPQKVKKMQAVFEKLASIVAKTGSHRTTPVIAAVNDYGLYVALGVILFLFIIIIIMSVMLARKN